MRVDEPSLTARGVALARSRLDRPSSPTGDPDAEARLAAGLSDELPSRTGGDRRGRGDDFLAFMRVRTRFFDDAVVRAIADGVSQIVILGAGYDGRALRFRTPGVSFFEVDHPATQRDKRRRLAAAAARADDIVFVAADFTEPGLDRALATAGHDRTTRTQFLCEGVLRYLPEHWFRELLRTVASVSAPGSELAVSISTREAGDERDESRERSLAESGEPVLTVPAPDAALRWLADAGWTIASVDDRAGRAPDSRRGRLLVSARRDAPA